MMKHQILFWGPRQRLCIRSIGRMITRLSLLQLEVWYSISGHVKSDTAIPTASHRYDILRKKLWCLGRNGAQMGPPIRYTLWRIIERLERQFFDFC